MTAIIAQYNKPTVFYIIRRDYSINLSKGRCNLTWILMERPSGDHNFCLRHSGSVKTLEELEGLEELEVPGVSGGRSLLKFNKKKKAEKFLEDFLENRVLDFVLMEDLYDPAEFYVEGYVK